MTAAPALPTALLVALSCLHGACASRSELRSPPSVTPLEEPAADPQCTAVTQYAATEIERGQWLRARHLLRLAEPRCAEPVAQALARLHAELQDERTPKALLHSAQTARQTGDDQSAGLAEAKAVLALERQSGQPLRVLGRLAVSDWDWSRDGKHVSVKRGDVLEVHDLPRAEVLSRIPRERLTEELELNTKVRRLVVRATSDECNATINVYDSQTGAKLRSPCGEDWQFSADGTHLAILERSQGSFAVTLLNSTTLELLARIPLPSAGDGSHDALVLDQAGRTLAVGHTRGLSLIDMLDGSVHELPGVNGDAIAAVGRRILWQDRDGIGVWDGATEHAHRFTRPDCGLPATLSDDGRKAAFSCSDGVWLWSPDSNESKRLFGSVQVTELDWLSNARHLRVGAYVDYETKVLVYDTETRRELELAGPGQQLLDVSKVASIALVQDNEQGSRIIQLSADGSLSTLAHGCDELGPLLRQTPNHAAFECTVANETKTLIFESGRESFRRVPTPEGAATVRGGFLVGPELTVSDLQTGQLVSTSAQMPMSPSWEVYWGHGAIATGTTRRTIFDEVLGIPIEADPRLSIRLRDGQRLAVHHEPPSRDCGPAASSHSQRDITWSSAPPYPICNRWTGEVIAQLPFAEAPSEFSLPMVSSDGRFLTIAAANAPRLFQIETGKEISLAGSPGNARFAGPLLIGADNKGSDGVWDPQTGKRLFTWSGGHHIPTTAHVGLGVAVVNLPNQPVTVVALDNGAVLATLDVHGTKGIDLGPSGVLAVVESQQLSFWRVPSARRLRAGRLPERVGTLLLGGDDAVFIADSGGFEASGDPLHARRLLRCEVGLTEVPLEICIAALHEPGLTARSLELEPKSDRR